MLSLESENDSEVSEIYLRIGESPLTQYRHFYRLASDAIRDLECPDVFRLRAKTDRDAHILLALRDQWIKAGRPQITWPESLS
jgi:hypothetical protein